MVKRVSFALILALILASTATVSAEDQLLGYFEFEDGTYWEREYTDGSFDSNLTFTFYELTVPSEGLLEFTVQSEYDDSNDPVIPGSFSKPPHDVNLMIAQPGPGEDAFLDPVWLEPAMAYNVTAGRVVVAVFPDPYFIGGVIGPPEDPNYDETTFDYLNIHGNVYFSFTPVGEAPSATTSSLIDHIICGDVTEDFTPADIRNSFKPAETVFSLLNLGDMNEGDTLTWTFSGPKDVTYMDSLTLETGGDVTAYYPLDLQLFDEPAGDWIVSVDINGNLMRADTFIVEGDTGFIPIPGWTMFLGLAAVLLVLRNRRTLSIQ